MNILFICSRNKKRSLTAQTIFLKERAFTVASAGTEESARVKVSAKLIEQADIIFVMEKVHKEKIMLKFGDLLNDKKIIVLNIPDEYEYMEDELVKMLRDQVQAYIHVN